MLLVDDGASVCEYVLNDGDYGYMEVNEHTQSGFPLLYFGLHIDYFKLFLFFRSCVATGFWLIS